MPPIFEWSEAKAQANARNHGFTFDEAVTVFSDPNSLTIYDERHSQDEDRFIDIGRSANGRLLVVVYTERAGRIRLISSRRATATEQREYDRS